VAVVTNSAARRRRLTDAEKRDRAALLAIREPGPTTRGRVVRTTSKATLARLERRGWVQRDPQSEYTDVLALTYDGEDYLAVLLETWHD
jgi:hypothetical protein